MKRSTRSRAALTAMVMMVTLGSTGCVHYSGVTSIFCPFYTNRAALYFLEPSPETPSFQWIIPGILGTDCWTE